MSHKHSIFHRPMLEDDDDDGQEGGMKRREAHFRESVGGYTPNGKGTGVFVLKSNN